MYTESHCAMTNVSFIKLVVFVKKILHKIRLLKNPAGMFLVRRFYSVFLFRGGVGGKRMLDIFS